jgi:lysophospholipase L1-like esterase
MRSLAARLFLALASLSITLGGAELICRQWFGERLAVETDERNLLYGFDATLGWFPRPSTERRFVGEREIAVRHNSLGLRDIEIGPKTPGRLRIAFFGDSFVWGYDANAEERVTDLLRADHPEWDIVNCGVSGYGTDQALLLFERLAPVLHPDVVVLEFNRADRNDNICSKNLGGYGKPVFLVEGNALKLANVPVPLLAKARWSESALYRHSYLWRLLLTRAPEATVAVFEDPSERIVDRLNAESRAAGARLILLIEGTDEAMRAHAEARSIPVVETAHALDDAAQPGAPMRFPSHGLHWTPAGNRVVATLLEALLASMSDVRP